MARKRLTFQFLRKLGIRENMIASMMITAAIGVAGLKNLKAGDVYKIKTVYPDSGIVRTVEDGDTLELYNGSRIRLVGINSPERGEQGYLEAKEGLEKLTVGKKVWLEDDRYQEDPNNRALNWVWLECTNPRFTDAKYMHLSGNKSREGLKENPKGCEKGILVQEELIKSGHAVVVVYKDRGELKYEERLLRLHSQ